MTGPPSLVGGRREGTAPAPIAGGPRAVPERLVELERRVARLEAFGEALLYALLALPVALILVLVRRPSGVFAEQAFNAAHVLMSGVVALVFLRVSRRLLAGPPARAWLHPFIALTLATFVGGALEVVQIVAPGQPSFRDLALDILGAMSALTFAVSVDRRRFPDVARSILKRWTLRVAAAFLLVLGLAPLANNTIKATLRARAFPVLADFETQAEPGSVVAEYGAELSLVPPPAGFSNASGKQVARVRFLANKAPKLELTRLRGDWSAYKSLVFDVYSNEAESVQFQLRIHDEKHTNKMDDRFNTVMAVHPGQTRLSIPIERIRDAPKNRKMDLARIESIILFMHEPAETVSLYFDQFRLEH